MKDDNLKVVLPNHLRGRSLDTKVIPMLCHLKTTLNHLVELKGDASLLKQWEKRSYRAYCLGEIQDLIVESYPEEWPEIVKEHISVSYTHLVLFLQKVLLLTSQRYRLKQWFKI